MANFTPTDGERAALDRLFDLADGHGEQAVGARSLLCAWWNATDLGAFDFADLWRFDDPNIVAAITVIKMIAGKRVGSAADSSEGFGERMRSITRRVAQGRATAH